MSDNFKTTTDEADAAVPISHARILWIMAIVLVAAIIGSLIFATWRATAGLILGGILSFINYYWLKFALKSVFEKAVEGAKPKFLVGKYILRYFAIGAVIVLVFLTKIVSVVAVICGLLAFAAAILIETFILVIIHILKRKEI
ncbi:MAG: ATP synthase subunit I [Acidobacteria bacterium]|nr:ATP synthase subunit I [Acidobacteriota bacterium]